MNFVREQISNLAFSGCFVAVPGIPGIVTIPGPETRDLGGK